MGPYFNEMIRIRIQIGNEIPHIAGMWDFCAEQITSSHLKCAKVLPDQKKSFIANLNFRAKIIFGVIFKYLNFRAKKTKTVLTFWRENCYCFD